MDIQENIVEYKNIQKNIDALNKEKENIEKKLKEFYLIVIRKFDWVKEVEFLYRERISWCAIKEYTFTFNAPDCIRKELEFITQDNFNAFNILGESNIFSDNLNLHRVEFGTNEYQLATSNLEIIVEFFEKFGGKINGSFNDLLLQIKLFDRLIPFIH